MGEKQSVLLQVYTYAIEVIKDYRMCEYSDRIKNHFNLYFNSDEYELLQYISNHIDYYYYLLETSVLLIAPTRSGSTHMVNIFNDNNVRMLKLHNNLISLNNKNIYFKRYNMDKEKQEMDKCYPHETTESLKLDIFNYVYLSSMKSRINSIKEIIVLVRDPIEQLTSMLYWLRKHYANSPIQASNYMKYINFDKWIKGSYINKMNIDLSNDIVKYIKTDEIDNYILSRFDNKIKRINKISDEEYTNFKNKLSFDKEYIKELYSGDIISTKYSPNFDNSIKKEIHFTCDEDIINLFDVYTQIKL